MKLGISAFAWTRSFGMKHLSWLPKVREYGFEGLEIPMFRPRDLPVAPLRMAFESNEMDCTVCVILPSGVNPIDADSDVRRRALAHLVECVEVAAELGARLLGGPVYAPIGYAVERRSTEEEWKRAIEMLQRLGEKLDENRMRLAVEPVNRSETSLLRTTEEARRLCAEIGNPAIGVTVDTFHANIEEKCIASSIERLGPMLSHLHLSENDRGVPGSGHVPFPEIVATLRKMEYEGYGVIEGFGYAADEPDSPGALLADYAVSPEDIALRGLQYIRSLSVREC